MKTFFDGFDPKGEIFYSPIDVTLGDRNVVQPDILFVSSNRREIMRKERINGPCDLVVEIRRRRVPEGSLEEDEVPESRYPALLDR